MGEFSPWHWAIVILLAVLLFGARRLPDAARSLGRSARILKAELRGDAGETASTGESAPQQADPPRAVAPEQETVPPPVAQPDTSRASGA